MPVIMLTEGILYLNHILFFACSTAFYTVELKYIL